jgi:hypothetical protein
MTEQKKKGIFIETVRGGRELLKVAPPPPTKQAPANPPPTQPASSSPAQPPQVERTTGASQKSGE